MVTKYMLKDRELVKRMLFKLSLRRSKYENCLISMNCFNFDIMISTNKRASQFEEH